MPLYVFECPACKRQHERLRRLGDTEPSYCVEDLTDMPRVYGYSMAITHPEPDTRGMYRRFSEASAEMDHQGVDGSGLWKQAKARAAALDRAGENPWQRS